MITQHTRSLASIPQFALDYSRASQATPLRRLGIAEIIAVARQGFRLLALRPIRLRISFQSRPLPPPPLLAQ
jgi:hypothetical protein